MSKYLLSVDPGTRITGVAWWVDGKLKAADNITDRDKHKLARSVLDFAVMCRNAHDIPGDVSLAIEFPEIYAKWSKIDPNDILTLAAFAGVVEYLVHHMYDANSWRYAPKEWKGQLKKTVTKNRCLAILSDEEKNATGLRTAGKALDVWDAVGLGLHHLGRHLF